MIQDIKVKIAERLLKKDDKEKNYALHIVGTIVIVALALTALTFWFPISLGRPAPAPVGAVFYIGDGSTVSR